MAKVLKPKPHNNDGTFVSAKNLVEAAMIRKKLPKPTLNDGSFVVSEKVGNKVLFTVVYIAHDEYVFGIREDALAANGNEALVAAAQRATEEEKFKVTGFNTSPIFIRFEIDFAQTNEASRKLDFLLDQMFPSVDGFNAAIEEMMERTATLMPTIPAIA